MKAVVLAAGIGKRLATLTVDKPKVLVTIEVKTFKGNKLVATERKTLIQHNLDKLRRLGINQIALVIGYKGEMVKEFLGNTVTYYTQKEQLGTAHAFYCAKDFIDEPFFLGLNGDMFFTDPLKDFIRLTPPAIAVYPVKDARRYGRLEIQNGRLVSVKEKAAEATPGYINAGVYLFPKEIFEWIEKTPLSPRKEYEVTDTIQMMINEDWRFTAYELKGFWRDIAYVSDIEEAQRAVSKTRQNR